MYEVMRYWTKTIRLVSEEHDFGGVAEPAMVVLALVEVVGPTPTLVEMTLRVICGLKAPVGD